MIVENINSLLVAVRLTACLCLFVLLCQMQKSYMFQGLEDRAGTLYKKVKEKSLLNMKEKNGLSRYQIIKQRIQANGLYYKTGGRITPFEYQLIRFVSSLIFLFVGLKIHIALMIPAGVLGFFLLDILMHKSNELENQDMLHDIETIYNAMKLHTSSGVYIINALYECRRLVKTARLANALEELVMEILGTQDAESAAENFKSKFANQYIDSLAIAIKQSLDGETTQIFEDMARQIDSINDAMLLKEENRKEAVLLLVDSLIFAGILAVTMYVSFVGLGMSFTNMF